MRYKLQTSSMLAAAMAAALFAGTPAIAAAPPPATVGKVSPAAETQRLGEDLARTLFEAANFKTLVSGKMLETSGTFDDLDIRPEWPQLMKDSITEEIEHDMPAIYRMFGKGFAKTMSVEEMQAGLIIFRDPALAEVIAAAAAGRPAPKTAKVGKEATKASETRAGRSFLEKLSNIETMMDGLENDFAAELLPGIFRRFADKAEALEATRPAN